MCGVCVSDINVLFWMCVCLPDNSDDDADDHVELRVFEYHPQRSLPGPSHASAACAEHANRVHAHTPVKLVVTVWGRIQCGSGNEVC